MRVLVTGAAGLIGSAVASLLVARGHSVIGMVRSNKALPGGVTGLSGDVTSALLGLGKRDYEALSNGLDLVVHSAALTQFSAPVDAYTRVNVEGVRNILALCAHAGCPLLHVSTAYVCGDAEGAVSEDLPATTSGFANPYEESKGAGERLVEIARAAGAPIAIARPSVVMGEWESGAIAEFSDVYRFIRLLAQGQVKVLPVGRDATFDFVPIDHVVRAIVAIAERMPQAAGRNFHLVSGDPFPIPLLASIIGEIPGFHEPRIVAPEELQVDRLPRAEQRMHLLATQSYASYMQRNPRFLDDNLRELTGLQCPPTDADYFRRLLAFAIGQGFFKPARNSARQEPAIC